MQPKHYQQKALDEPTGGGKTLLACYAIDHIQRALFGRQTGLVVWVMPSAEIDRQTAIRCHAACLSTAPAIFCITRKAM